MIPRCLLFVSALDRARYDKALASGADAICVDLEDAVAPSRKDEARATLVTWLKESAPDPRVWVRINAPAGEAGTRDVATLAALRRSPALMVPKVESAATLAALAAAFAAPPQLMPLIETVPGLAAVEAIAAARPAPAALLFGPADLSLALGARPTWEALLYARSRTVLAARLAGIAALDGPCLSIADDAAGAEEARRAFELGFDGKAAVHPRQVNGVLDAFAPSSAELAFARKVVAAFADEAQGAVAIDGRLVDGPLIEQARRVLRRAGEA